MHWNPEKCAQNSEIKLDEVTFFLPGMSSEIYLWNFWRYSLDTVCLRNSHKKRCRGSKFGGQCKFSSGNYSVCCTIRMPIITRKRGTIMETWLFIRMTTIVTSHQSFSHECGRLSIMCFNPWYFEWSFPSQQHRCQTPQSLLTTSWTTSTEKAA